MAKKGNIQSIRFSDEIKEIIESQEGETFTAKFESLIRKCYQDIPAKETELKYVQMRVEAERDRLNRIQKKASDLERTVNNLQYILASCNNQTKAAIKSLESMMNEP